MVDRVYLVQKATRTDDRAPTLKNRVSLLPGRKKKLKILVETPRKYDNKSHLFLAIFVFVVGLSRILL